MTFEIEDNTIAYVNHDPSKGPWIVSSEAFEGYEDLWTNAHDHTRLPYHTVGTDGQPIPTPVQWDEYLKGLRDMLPWMN
jgi:hypothetical protein